MKQLWLTAKLDMAESLRARWFLIYTLVFGGIVALLFLFGPLFIISPIQLGYSTFQESNITVYFPASRIDLGREVLQTAKRAAQVNEQFYRMPTKTKVLVAGSKLDMLRFGAPPDAGGIGTELGITVSG